ncbi:hypothetical protein [Pseudomonas sp. KBW05]|uniref:hypothetical protein n=1 Tax=Pseudomonas sp. KBW05 TaxID=2153360 RepID=UPI000F5A7306|nr:hypothetical protein [Pseudomonas sp. KBW05]RQO58264.1 hypothetical protein DBR46_08125 [Pseudomonas sp. KBW05]
MNAPILSASVSVSPLLCPAPAEQPTAPMVEKAKNWANAFNVGERRFGENFDGTSHAAVIKMMMATLGPTPTDMFDQVTPSDRGYDVTMKDEFKVHVSQDELRQVAQASRFGGDDTEVVKAANFALAVFVKRKQSVGGYAGFEAALAKTLQGETTLRCLQGMGVYGLSQYVPPSEMVGEGVVAVMGTHNFGSTLVVDGVGHHDGFPRQVGNSYGYRLFPSNTRARLAKTVTEKPSDVWSGFYQGANGNCATVSAIKAAMMRFGQKPQDILRKVTERPEGFEVSMRDGFPLTLTHEELAKARQVSQLMGADPVLLEDANFLYAVSAKRAQLKNNDFRARQGFEVAMQTLNDGDFPGNALRRLGLLAYVRESSAEELAKGAIGTLAGNGHSVAVIDGALDLFGKKESLLSSRWMNNSLWAQKLV